MNITIRRSDKRIALVLSAVFAWLFIGSLIMFHQEQVFGKHLRYGCEFFISPKSKDKQNQTIKLQKLQLNNYDNGNAPAIILDDFYSTGAYLVVESLPAHFLNLFIEDVFLTSSSLRAPPVA